MSEEDGPRGQGRLTAGAVCVIAAAAAAVLVAVLGAAECAGGYEKEDGPVEEDEDDRA